MWRVWQAHPVPPVLRRPLLATCIGLTAPAGLAMIGIGIAAVVVLMTVFPMLVSTLAGLQASGKLERELMYGYAASYSRTLLALRDEIGIDLNEDKD